MISCQGVMERLWDYLDGELPPERMTEMADHLAVCRRCYPQYRFQFAFLETIARERARVPGPSEELVEQVRRLIASHQPG